eukprot:gene132-211_t
MTNNVAKTPQLPLLRLWGTGDNAANVKVNYVKVYRRRFGNKSRCIGGTSCQAKQFVVDKGDAKCIDGTPPVYYLRTGSGNGIRKWHVHFEGGAWCENFNTCSMRAKTTLGSSLRLPKCMTLPHWGTYLDANRFDNPLLYNFNTVYVRYCDGGSYAGNTAVIVNGTTLYFHGMHNRNEVIKNLLSGQGMSDATEVLISGCSAGALGVYLGIDEMSQIIHNINPKTKVLGLADSGFFLDYTSPYQDHYSKEWLTKTNPKRINEKLDYANYMREVSQYMNISAGTNKLCIQKHKSDGERTRCMFAQHLLPFIKTPIFSLQPIYDYWQIWHVIGRPQEHKLVNEFGSNLTQLMTNALQHKHHGVYFDSCTHHCLSCSDKGDNLWDGMSVRSKEHLSPSNAFFLWFTEHHQQEEPKIHQQNKPFPCDDCCKCRS